MTSYRVTVQLGALTWNIEPTDADAADEDRVLDGLRIGWSMPEGLWPQQPDPMTASLALNVPDFTSDVHDLTEGDQCAVAVYLVDDDGLHETMTTTFYGRITDLKAVPRPNRPGVTLSIAAVDYIVDLAELDPWAPAPGATWDAPTFLAQLWDDRIASDFPTWDASLGANAIDPALDNRKVSEVIAFELVQNIGTTLGEPTHRAIIAPYIDFSTGTLDATQEWAFDMVYKESSEPAYEIPCAKVERQSLTWLYSKQTGPNSVFVTGEHVQASAAHPGILHRRTATIEVTLEDSPEPVAEFYLPDPDPSGWRISTFRFLATRGGIDIDDAPVALFPSWTLSPGSPDRSSCYGRPIVVTGVPNDRNPLATGAGVSDIGGRLTAATVTVQAGHMAFEFQLRQTAM